MPRHPQPESDLPKAELEVLACLWQLRRATARELREALAPHRPMAHGSMMTLLKRLEAKGCVVKEKAPVGKAFVFKPGLRPEPTYRRLVKNLRDRVFGGSGLALVSSLFETQPPSDDELDAMQALLDDLRQKKRKL